MNCKMGIVLLTIVCVLAGTAAAGQPADWAGWYAGAFGGYISGELNSNDPDHAASTGEYDDSGMMAGLFGGLRSQGENDWVYGFEAILPLHMDKGTAVDQVYFPGLVTYEADYKYALFVGANAGKAMGRGLPYAFGTVGFANVDGKTHNVNLAEEYEPGFVQNAAATHFVWQLGAGLDYQISPDYFLGGRFALFTAAKADHTMPWNEPGPNKFGFDATLVQFQVGRRF